MTELVRLSAAQSKQLIDDNKPAIVDIREQHIYAHAHIPGAFLLNNTSVTEFIEQTSPDTPVLVYCYHGISSINAGHYLLEQGFERVYSLDGGFEAWLATYPTDVINGDN
jgi:thiosulfate sulfurtransferase